MDHVYTAKIDFVPKPLSALNRQKNVSERYILFGYGWSWFYLLIFRIYFLKNRQNLTEKSQSFVEFYENFTRLI